MARIFQLCSPCPQLPSAKPLRRGLGAKCQRRVNHFIVRTDFIACGTLAFPYLYPHFVPLKVQFKSVCYKTQQAQPQPKPFMSNWLWISPWMKSISYKSDVTFYLLHYNRRVQYVLWNRLWPHQLKANTLWMRTACDCHQRQTVDHKVWKVKYLTP